MRRCGSVAFGLMLVCLGPGRGEATTRYHVRMNPQQVSGLMTTLAFEFTSSDTNTNTARILNFVHDGRAGPATHDGGPIFGKLLEGANPADTTTIEDFGFYAEVGVPFDSLGSQIRFSADLTEGAPAQLGLPDELSLFLLRHPDLRPFPTADDLGADALFAIDVTGQSGGDLSVFTPLTFVAPDSLILDGTILNVPADSRGAGRLRFRSTAPNPFASGIRLTYDVPEPGGLLRVKVYDAAGRLMAEPFAGKREPGVWTTQWDATNMRGRPVPAGVYIVQLQMNGQSLVRRIVLTR